MIDEYLGRRIKVVNLDNWSNQYSEVIKSYLYHEGEIAKDYRSGHRFVIRWDDPYLLNYDQSIGKLCIRLENVEFLVPIKPITPEEFYKNVYQVMKGN